MARKNERTVTHPDGTTTTRTTPHVYAAVTVHSHLRTQEMIDVERARALRYAAEYAGKVNDKLNGAYYQHQGKKEQERAERLASEQPRRVWSVLRWHHDHGTACEYARSKECAHYCASGTVQVVALDENGNADMRPVQPVQAPTTHHPAQLRALLLTNWTREACAQACGVSLEAVKRAEEQLWKAGLP